MADYEQALQDDRGISRASTTFGVDTPIAPPLTGDEGGQTPFSEYFLHSKVTLVPQGWAGAGHRTLVNVWLGHCRGWVTVWSWVGRAWGMGAVLWHP